MRRAGDHPRTRRALGAIALESSAIRGLIKLMIDWWPMIYLAVLAGLLTLVQR